MPFFTGICAIVENMERAENFLLSCDEREHIKGVRYLREARLALETWHKNEVAAELARREAEV